MLKLHYAPLLRARIAGHDVAAFTAWAASAGETRRALAERIGIDGKTLRILERDPGPVVERWGRLVALLWAHEWEQAHALAPLAEAGDPEAQRALRYPPRPPWVTP